MRYETDSWKLMQSNLRGENIEPAYAFEWKEKDFMPYNFFALDNHRCVFSRLQELWLLDISNNSLELLDHGVASVAPIENKGIITTKNSKIFYTPFETFLPKEILIPDTYILGMQIL